MFDTTLFYNPFHSWPNINTLCNVVDREKFSIFRVDHQVSKSDHKFSAG